MGHPYPSLDREIAIGGVTARNRIMMATHGPRLSQPRYLRYIEERARGGVALMGFNLGILGSMAYPFGPGRGTPEISLAEGDGVPPHPLTADGRTYYDSLIPAARTWADAAKAHGTLAIGQLYHAGAALHGDNYQPAVSPSGVVDEYGHHRPHVLTGAEIADLIQAYGESGRRARDAGYDLIELHGAHGYLIQQFLSPLTNFRTDGWGGVFDNRARFLVEVIAAVRAAVDDAVPVGLRLTGPEVEGGLTIDDIVEAAARAEAAGIAYVSLSGGTYTGLWKGANRAYVASAMTPPAPNVPAAAAVKARIGVPVMVTGQITTLAQAEAIVAEGKADVVGMVRALMAEPRLVSKGFAGDGDARPCINGNECHYGRPVACAVNPATGREAFMEATPAETRKRVLVIGGGPAGMECALAAARRGHEVVLAEASDALGGRLRLLRQVSQQARFGDYIDYAAKRIAAAPIDVRLGVAVDAAFARTVGPDAIVVASGAVWGRSLGTIADLALAAPDSLGHHVAVVGGRDDHLPPLVAADYLAGRGHRVTLLTEMAVPGKEVEPASLFAVLRRLHERGVDIRSFTAATGFSGGRLETRNTLTNSVGGIDDVDGVVDIDTRASDADAADAYSDIAPQFRIIGDALSPRRMLHATLDGARMGLQL